MVMVLRWLRACLSKYHLRTQRHTSCLYSTPNRLKDSSFASSFDSLSISSTMDLRTPDRMAVSDVSPGVFSTPLSSPPSNVAPPSSPLGTVTNEYISQDMEVDSDIHSVDIYSSESEESRLGEDDRGTAS